MFSLATCTPPPFPPPDLKGDAITEPFSCVLEAEKHRCVAGGGVCTMQRDGESSFPLLSLHLSSQKCR